MTKKENIAPDIYERSIDYHTFPKPGKLEIKPTKTLADQTDLSLAYSPGVAGPCLLIHKFPEKASQVTSRGNLIAVITNGTAVLGLGDIGPLASKPVMEGKAVLFKKFAGIDVFDIEINEKDPDKLIDIIASLEPTFGGINLEDIKSPECFYIERKLKERMKIPIFHDDQHGTAIIVGAAVLNGLKLLNKKIEDVKLVTSGAGAAAIACLDLLVALGMNPENIIATDSSGVVYKGRGKQMDSDKERYATSGPARSLAQALESADIFLGLSVGGIVTPEMIAKMPPNPLILALANPEPEIRPDVIKQVRNDAIIATGRSDYPNQVNNVLCFPFIFRGALDVGATTINESMKIACVHALAGLTQAESSDIVCNAYGGEIYRFGSEYIIPKPFDPRLIVNLSSAVAQAAMDSGVATRPIANMKEYEEYLQQYIYSSSLIMKPVFSKAKADPKRLIFAEGEEERVLRAVQIICDEKLARPILIGRPEIIEKRIDSLGLRLKEKHDYDLVNPQDDPRFSKYWRTYYDLTKRNGVSPDMAKTLMRTDNTIIAATSVYLNDADTMLCGSIGRYRHHLQHIQDIFGVSRQYGIGAALNVLILESGPLFICDTYINDNPSAQEIAQITLMAAEQVKKFGIDPKIALLSHSNFGSRSTPEGRKMKEAYRIVSQLAPDLEVDGEMHADCALSENVRERAFPNSNLKGNANLLIFPNLDAANISFNMTKILSKARSIGPILLGYNLSGHILSQTVSVRGILNLSAYCVVDAQMREKQ